MIPKWKTEEKDKKSQKHVKMAKNSVFVPADTPLTDPNFEFF